MISDSDRSEGRRLLAEQLADIAFVRDQAVAAYKVEQEGAWPTYDVLRQLADAADHLLLLEHDCDRHGYENLGIARNIARARIQEGERSDDPKTRLIAVLGERVTDRIAFGAPDECWPWLGHLNDHGYGRLDFRGRSVFAHRLVYETVIGPIPEGLNLDHLCHKPEECASGDACPHRRCANPRHLAATRIRDNVLRGTGPSAKNARATHCKHGHALTDDNVFVRGGSRYCRTCDEAGKAKRATYARALYARQKRERGGLIEDPTPSEGGEG